MTFATYSKNFRGSPNGWVHICRSNFLVGENSTGKSSYLKLFKVVMSADFQLRNSVYLRDRPDFNFDDFFSKIASDEERKSKTFEIGCVGFRKDVSNYVGRIATYKERSGSPYMTKLSFLFGFSIYRFATEPDDLRIFEKKLRKDISLEGIKKAILKFHGAEIEDLGNPIHVESSAKNFSEDNHEPDVASLKFEVQGNTQTGLPFVPDLIANVDHLGPIRARPGKVYQVGGDKKSIQGEKSLDKLATQDANTISACNKFGEESGLFDAMEVNIIEELGPNNIIITFKKNGKTFFSEELGFGVGQIVPILIEATRPRKKNVLIAEQPELHLHPKAQSAFGKLLENFSEDGHTSLIETHSDYVLDKFRVQRANRKEVSTSSQVLFFYNRGSKNLVKSIKVNSDGGLINPPSNYRSFFFREEMKMLDLL